jgi:hypothetical protein
MDALEVRPVNPHVVVVVFPVDELEEALLVQQPPEVAVQGLLV